MAVDVLKYWSGGVDLVGYEARMVLIQERKKLVGSA